MAQDKLQFIGVDFAREKDRTIIIPPSEEKSFDELFPELKNKEMTEKFYLHNEQETLVFIPVSELRLHCLSKQYVRNAIDDLSCCHAPNVCQCCQQLEELKKSLGLSDTLFGIKIQVDKNLKPNEAELRSR